MKSQVVSALLVTLFLLAGQVDAAGGGGNGEGYYNDEHIYQTRPNPAGESFFGIIGTTGLKARVYPGAVSYTHLTLPTIYSV